MSEHDETETPRRYVTMKDPPRRGDTIMLHGHACDVVSIKRDQVTLEAPGRNWRGWYWLQSLEIAKAYYA